MFGFALTPLMKYVAIAATFVVLFTTGYYKGYRNTQDKFDTYKAEVTAVAAQQEEKTKLIEAKAQKITKETINAYKNNLTTVRSYYDGLRNSKGSSNMSTISDTSSGTDARPSYDVLAGQCAETTLQIVTLQNFIKSVNSSY